MAWVRENDFKAQGNTPAPSQGSGGLLEQLLAFLSQPVVPSLYNGRKIPPLFNQGISLPSTSGEPYHFDHGRTLSAGGGGAIPAGPVYGSPTPPSMGEVVDPSVLPSTQPSAQPSAKPPVKAPAKGRGGRALGSAPPGIVESLVAGMQGDGGRGAMMPGLNQTMNQYVAQQNAFANTPEQQAINARYNELLAQYGMTPPAPTPQTIEEYNAQFFQPPPPQAATPPVYDPQQDWTSRQLMNALMLLGR